LRRNACTLAATVTKGRSASGSLGYFKDITAPVPIKDEESTSRLIETDIDRIDAGHRSKGQPSPRYYLVAHPIDDIRDCARNRANTAPMKHDRGRHGGLQDSRKRGAVKDTDSPEWDAEASRH
jgi:hypothetical protein